MAKNYIITEQDYYRIQAIADWAEYQGSAASAKFLRDALNRATSNVFLVFAAVPWDGEYLKSVHASEDGAKAEMEHLENLDPHTDYEIQVFNLQP